ncbi:MAG: hypothetical protein OXI27_08800 [Thaumarchaeota archaeon]|nr:hypothetical protein [Nitrososphaerota archaeon]MDE0526673.1 hypothetical protein [Nitrososphaerota archaeon]
MSSYGECPACDDSTQLEKMEVDIGGGPDTLVTVQCPKCGFNPEAGH